MQRRWRLRPSRCLSNRTIWRESGRFGSTISGRSRAPPGESLFARSTLSIPPKSSGDFHLFRTGVEPKWEDPECANGGKWTVPSSTKPTLDKMWLETLMALIGEQFGEMEEICGVVASVCQRGDKISLWTKNATNEAVQMSIGRKWKEVIDVDDNINYSFHDDSRRDRSLKGRYSV